MTRENGVVQMSEEITLSIILVLSLVILYFVVKKIKAIAVPPDPWEKEDLKTDENDLGVCVNCLTPIKEGKQHYCPKCGNVTGEYTRYIPYVNIKFNYSIFETIAKKMKVFFNKI